MKKIFTLFFALFTMAFFANAQQVTVILEAHDVWQDGSGYQLLLDADHTAYGTVIPTSGALTSNASATVDYSATFEYTIPTNANGSASSTNVVVDGSVTITIPAGTYDFCVTNPTPGDRIWIAGGENGRQDDYVFSDAYIYHFTVAREGTGDAVTIEMIPNTTEPTINVTPSAIDFSTVTLSNSSVETASISAFNLTAGITATTTAPFSVSADDITYSTTATIGQNGGTLYVKYTPTAAGNHNGTVTLSSTGATNVTITLTGSCVDCATNNITTFPYVYTFNDGIIPPLCWGYNDAAHFGVLTVDEEAGDYAAIIGVVDYLITPEITSTSPLNMSIDYLTYAGMNQLEGSSTFRIGYSTTNNNYSSFTWLTPVEAVEATGLFTTYSSIIPTGTKYIAIDVTEINTFYGGQYYNYLFFDNLTLSEINNAEIFASTDSVSFGIVQLNNEAIESISVVGALLTSDITATTAAPFSVSADGTTYGTTATFTQAGGTLYVKYAPTAAATNNGMVTLTSTGVTDVTITLTGTGLDCSNNPLPYTNDFTDEALNDCWTIVDANNDGSTFEFSTSGYAVYSYNDENNANDWLISPVFAIPATGASASFDYAVGGSSYPEKYSVYVIANGQTYANATQVIATQEVNNTSWETQYIDLSTFYNQSIQIGIKCESDADEYLFAVTNFFIGGEIPTTVTVNPTSIDFGTIPAGTSLDAMVIISSTNLNEAINITTNAPYEVSLDGNTYSTTVSIPANSALAVNDTVYVQFAPTTAGTFNNIVTISTTSTNDTIILAGASIECNTITTFPFTEDFEETSATLSCWTINDANNDGHTFSFYNGTARYHWDSNNDADDWLISPEMTLTGSQIATFDYWSQSSYYAERFQVYAIAAGSTPTPLTNAIDVTNTTAESQIVDLSSLTGNYRIAIKCISDADQYYLNIDNFVVSDVSTASLSVDPTSMNFSTVIGSAPIAQTANVSGLALTEAITITAPANFEVSTDNVTFGSTATIANTGVATQATLYVQYNPVSAGSHTGNVTLTSGSLSATIALTGIATEPLDCNVPASLPFFEGFEGEDIPDCWTSVDADGDGHEWYVLNNSQSSQGGFNVHSGEGHITSASYASGALTPDNWLITPQIAMGTNGHLSFWAAGQDPDYAAEVFSVYLSTTGPSITDFTVTLLDHQTTTGTMTEYTADLSAYAGQNVYIAFRHHDISDMFRLNLDDVSITGETSIAEVENNNVSVYPNPANNVINVNANSNISNVEVFTIAGQKVGDFTANSNSIAISTSNLTSGLYLMQIHTENGVINKKFTVAR